ncbi:MAG: MFS transporter [Alphaproteobacteria bacterium]
MYAQAVIVLIGFSGFVGLSIVIPVLPHYAAAYGASAFGATLAFAIAAGVAMFSSILWGRLSDLVGRKPIIVVSLLGQSAAFLWLAFAGSLTEVYAARALEGFFVGSVPALFAAMADVTSEEQRAGAMGRLGVGTTAGFIVGPVLGGILTTAFTDAPSFFPPFFFTSSVFVVLAVAVIFVLPESRSRQARDAAKAHDRQSFGQRARAYLHPRLSVPMLGATMVSFASNSTSAIFALWALARFGWGVAETSYAITAMAALVMAWKLASGWLARTFGTVGLLTLTQGAVVVAFGGLVFVDGVVPLYLLLVVAAFGNGLGRTAAQTMTSINAGADRRGEALGVQGTLSSAATAGGPLLAGWLFVTLSPNAPFAVIAGVGAVVFAVTGAYLLVQSRRGIAG